LFSGNYNTTENGSNGILERKEDITLHVKSPKSAKLHIPLICSFRIEKELWEFATGHFGRAPMFFFLTF
jgi:hypothetical protein